MSWPVRHLPVLQNWDCQGCTDCCRSYRVYVSPAEAQRIEAQDWPDVGAPLVHAGALAHLNQQADGACVFLSAAGRCRIHERFGSDAKPLACRLYPFILVPGDREWRVGLRFACPAVASSQGRPLTEHGPALRQLAGEVQQQELPAGHVPKPPLLDQQQVSWSDAQQFVDALLALLTARADPIERRWRKCLALAALCRQARFDAVQGARLTEFLQLLTATLDADVPQRPADVPAPSWVGRVLFRVSLAALIRQDAGPHRGPDAQGRLALLRSAWRFARGRGAVPQLCAPFPATTFATLETPTGPLPAAAEEILERYYATKLASLQFCGAANHGVSFWQGLESLALTLPAVLWLRRAFTDLSAEAATARAVALVDSNFAYSPHLAGFFPRLAQRLLGNRGELERLIAWYSR